MMGPLQDRPPAGRPPAHRRQRCLLHLLFPLTRGGGPCAGLVSGVAVHCPLLSSAHLVGVTLVGVTFPFQNLLCRPEPVPGCFRPPGLQAQHLSRGVIWWQWQWPGHWVLREGGWRAASTRF